jgi:hypothetical protein
MKYALIASVTIPAIATPTGWARTAKTIYISTITPVWMVRIIDEWVRK